MCLIVSHLLSHRRKTACGTVFKLLHADMCLSSFDLAFINAEKECFELGTDYVEVCVGLSGVHSAGLTLLQRQFCCLFV